MAVENAYPWGAGFQMRLLALLAQEPKNMFDLIEPQYFTGNPIYVEIARVLKGVYAKVSKGTQISRHSLIELLRASVGKDDAWPVYKETVKRLYKIPLSDKEILFTQAREFAKEARYRNALELGEKYVTGRQYDKVHQLLDETRAAVNGAGAEAVKWSLLPHPRDFPFKEIEWTIDTILPTDAVIVLSGVEGVGKTLQALSWARAITEGTEFLGYQAWPRKVLYNGIDMSRTNLGNYLRMMRWDPDDDFRFISQWTGEGFTPSMLDDPAGVAWLCKYAKKYKPVMFFDTVRDYFSGEENSSTDWKPIADAARELRSLGATPVLLAHPDKSGKFTVRGSHLIAQKADIPYIVRKERWKDRELCVLQCPSKNRVGSTAFTLAMEMQFIPMPNDTPYFRFRERPDWKPGKMSNREGELDSVVAYVEEHPDCAQKQIEDALHMGGRKVKELVAAGEEEGRLHREKGPGKTWLWSTADDARGKVVDFDALDIPASGT
jgi:hypothetical protein